MRARGLSRIAVLSVFAILAAGPARAQRSEDVVLAVPNVALTFAPGYLAEDLGLFAKQGLNLKSVVIAGIGSANAVISGSADFAQISGATLTRAAARGQRMLAIVSTLNRPTIQIVVRKEIAAAAGFDPKSPLDKRAQVMRGRTIAVDSINSVIHAYVLLVARRAGYSADDIRIAPMAPTNAIAAFQTRQVDGFAMSMPWPLQPVLDGSAVVIASGSDGDPPDMYPFGHNVFVAKPETCEKSALPEITALAAPMPVTWIILKRKPCLAHRPSSSAMKVAVRLNVMFGTAMVTSSGVACCAHSGGGPRTHAAKTARGASVPNRMVNAHIRRCRGRRRI